MLQGLDMVNVFFNYECFCLFRVCSLKSNHSHAVSVQAHFPNPTPFSCSSVSLPPFSLFKVNRRIPSQIYQQNRHGHINSNKRNCLLSSSWSHPNLKDAVRDARMTAYLESFFWTSVEICSLLNLLDFSTMMRLDVHEKGVHLLLITFSGKEHS